MTSKDSLLADPRARLVRAAEKRTAVLRFLRGELFSTPAMLGRVMGVSSRQAVHAALKRMATEGVISLHRLRIFSEYMTLVGITAHGQALAFDPATEAMVGAHFDPRRVSITYLQHALDLQSARIAATAAGWTNWINGDRLGSLPKSAKRPDALAIAPTGARCAIEVERTFKTSKRYSAILLAYLQTFRRGDLDAAVWISPDPDRSARLRALVLSIPAVRIGTASYPIEPERHHARLFFCAARDWPTIQPEHSGYPLAAPSLLPATTMA